MGSGPCRHVGQVGARGLPVLVMQPQISVVVRYPQYQYS